MYLTSACSGHGYQNISFTTYCGFTPEFSWAGTRAKVNCNLALAQQFAIWKIAQNLHHQLMQNRTRQQAWMNQVQVIHHWSEGQDLLDLAWQTLQAAMALPPYPSKAIYLTQRDGRLLLTWYTSCPYTQFVKLGLRLVIDWLNWSMAISANGRISLNRESLKNWHAALNQLDLLLPSVPVRALHRQLWDKGIAWQWLGGDKTKTGAGIHQTTLTGMPNDGVLNHPEIWRVPIYTVTGSVGKTTTAKLLWQLLQSTGKTLALAASDGAWIGSKKVSEGDCIGGRSAQALLQSSAVEAAVFEQGRGGILKQGVPYTQSDIGILLNVKAVHLGLDGIDTLEQMADTKVTGLRPARVWVLNHDDIQCQRLSAQHASNRTVWFSVTSHVSELKVFSQQCLGVWGVARDELGQPVGVCLFQRGQEIKRFNLNGVAPYHGMLGEKTLEELLAAMAAAWFGPLAVNNLQARLSTLRLDSSNHAFRTSIHRQGNVVVVLDKAAELASLCDLKKIILEIAEREACRHRIAVLTRSAGETLERHQESAQVLHGFMDEFVCFDRPETYKTVYALPIYTPGSIPQLMKSYFERLNDEMGVSKPVTLANDWAAAQKFLNEKLAKVQDKTLVLINQPGTGLTDLNQQILAFANTGLKASSC